jgi:hypothetical protein
MLRNFYNGRNQGEHQLAPVVRPCSTCLPDPLQCLYTLWLTVRFSCSWRAPSCQSIHMLRDLDWSSIVCVTRSQRPGTHACQVNWGAVNGRRQSWPNMGIERDSFRIPLPRCDKNPQHPDAILTISRLHPASTWVFWNTTSPQRCKPRFSGSGNNMTTPASIAWSVPPWESRPVYQ